MQKLLGEQWIYPSELTLAEPVGISETYEIYEPNFSRRGFVFETINEPDYIISMIDWLVKSRVNEIFFTFTLWDQLKELIKPEIIKRGISVTLGGHSMKFFLNKESIVKELTADHPYSARRQLDYGVADWQEAVCEEIAAYCKDVPNLKRLSLWPEDVAINAESAQSESFMKQYIGFTELLHTVMQKNDMDVAVEHIAYNAGLAWEMLERKEIETSREVDTLFAYWGRDYRYSFLQSQQASDHRALHSLKDWVKQTGKHAKELTIFEYYSDQFMLTPLFPLLSERIVADLKEYKQLGIDGITNLVVPVRTIENHPWHWIHQFNSYVFCRACWGDSLEDILEDYYTYFSENEREWVKQAFKAVEEKLPKITSWNTPLFPARIVDPKMAKADKLEIQAASDWLLEISMSMQKLLQQSNISKENPAYVYIQHLAHYSNELKEQWQSK